MNKKEIKVAVEKGEIHCRIMLYVSGTPKKHVEDTLKSYVETISTDEGFTVIEAEYAPAEKNEGLYSSFVDLELLVKNTNLLTSLCFNYMPSSIEFIDPKEVVYKKKVMDIWFNDLLAKLHEINILSKQVGAQNKTVIANTNNLISNAIVMAVNMGKNVGEIAESLGMRKEDLEPFVKKLMENGKIKLVEEKPGSKK